MIHLGTAVIAVRDSQKAATLQQYLAASEYKCEHISDISDLTTELRHFQPDVLIIGSSFCEDNPGSVVRKIRSDPEFTHLAILYLAAESLAENVDVLLSIGLDDALQWPLTSDVLLAHIRPMVRVSTMRAEFLHRQTVLGRKSQSVELPIDYKTAIAKPVILLAGTDDTRLRILEACPDADVTVTSSLVETTQALDEKTFDMVAIAPTDNIQPWLDLCLQMRRNVRLFNIPVLFINRSPHHLNVQTCFGMGASRVMDGIPIIAELIFALHSLVKRQRTRWALKHALLDTLSSGGSDAAIEEVYSREFLMRSLELRMQGLSNSAHRNGWRRFSFVRFSFSGLNSIRHECGEEAERCLIAQIGQWLALLVRAEDIVGRFTPDSFAFILPDTPLNEADVVMQRIAGVVGNTEFAVEDVFHPVCVWPFVGATEIRRDDSLESIIERAEPDFGP